MSSRSNGVRRKNKAVPLPIWQELLVAVEMVCLKVSPVYWGFGIPPGDGSAVVVVPGFMGTDLYLSEFRAWLGRIGYKPYHSKIGLNASPRCVADTSKSMAGRPVRQTRQSTIPSDFV